MGTQVEVERKFDVDESFRLPDLTSAEGVTGVEVPVEHRLEATYVDTADLRLLRRRITLRRRRGGADAGWHLKLPGAGSQRLEVHRPPGRSARAVPGDLADLVRAHSRGEPLAPVARIRTRRTVHVLLDAAGNRLAEVADDRVRAEALPAEDGEAATTTSWREVEVELLDGGEDVLDAVASVLAGAGATPAGRASKVGRILAARLDRPGSGEADHATGGPARRPRGAGGVLAAYVREQVLVLQGCDPQVRLDTEDAVHRMRVSARRLRSVLAAYRPLVDPAVTEPVRDELRWLGRVLAPVRDVEVLHARLRAAVRALAPELVVGPVVRRIDLELRGARQETTQRMLVELETDRYRDLLDALDRLVLAFPLTERAQGKARPELLAGVSGAVRRVARAVRAAEAAETPELRAPALHEVRKAAKRARYAAELASARAGDPALALAAAMEELQEVLGSHQDSVVAREWLRNAGMRAYLDGENSFTYGLLHGLEAGEAEREERRVPDAWKRARRAAKDWPGR